jgi:hypothetical protein
VQYNLHALEQELVVFDCHMALIVRLLWHHKGTSGRCAPNLSIKNENNTNRGGFKRDTESLLQRQRYGVRAWTTECQFTEGMQDHSASFVLFCGAHLLTSAPESDVVKDVVQKL